MSSTRIPISTHVAGAHGGPSLQTVGAIVAVAFVFGVAVLAAELYGL